MGRSAVVDHAAVSGSASVPFPENDERWQVTQRVVASRHFIRSPLLSKFLLYIVAETIQGRAEEISEHQIGVHVFDRPPSYRTVEDNIVRSYARQLRRRLTDYFADGGSSEPLQIDIPLGGYIPFFLKPGQEEQESEDPERCVPKSLRKPADAALESPVETRRRSFVRKIPAPLLLGLYTVLIFSGTWFAAERVGRKKQNIPPVTAMTPLWNALFHTPARTYLVPADAGLNLIEDLSRHPLSLAGYIEGDYTTASLPAVDEHSAEDLRGQHFTSFVDLQIISSLSRLPEFDPERTILRFPRDLRLDDLKNANAVIIGSVGSNPWAAIAENNANFHIVYREGMQGATIVNSKPLPGELPEYVSRWSEPAHETFALISCLPNLEGNGRLLILQGLDVAGTQAAGEALFHPAAIASVLRKATRPDGSLRYFEILLRATSIESSATGTQVIGSRVY